MFKHLKKLKDFIIRKFLVSRDTAQPSIRDEFEQQVLPSDIETPSSQPTTQKSIPKITISQPVTLPVQEITLGLDFGTSTTKCIINLENRLGKSKYLIASFPSGINNEITLCYPTVIGIQGDHFVFGHLADTLPDKDVIRSVKIAIPCINNLWGSYKSSFMMIEKPGYFNINGNMFSAIDLSALYLARVIKQIKNQMSCYLGEKIQPIVYLNLAAPMDQLIGYYNIASTISEDIRKQMYLDNEVRDTRLSKWYQNLGQWCLRLSDYSQENWKISDAVDALKKVNSFPLKPYDKSPAYVIPETLAAITAYINKPGTRAGKYMSFDVGAGTTDISIFWLEKQNHTTKPWYYASGSCHIGIDDIDRALESLLSALEGYSLRHKRELYETTQCGLWGQRNSIQDVLSKILKHKERIFSRGYTKEPLAIKWGNRNSADFTILTLGGGCQLDVVQNIVNRGVWENVLGVAPYETLDLSLTGIVLTPDGKECILKDHSSLRKQSYLMIIAEGLANTITDIPEYGVASKPLYERPKISPYDYSYDHWW